MPIEPKNGQIARFTRFCSVNASTLGQEFADTFGHLHRRETEFFVEHFVWCREAKRFEAVNNAIGADEPFEIDRQTGSQTKFFDTARQYVFLIFSRLRAE